MGVGVTKGHHHHPIFTELAGSKDQLIRDPIGGGGGRVWLSLLESLPIGEKQSKGPGFRSNKRLLRTNNLCLRTQRPHSKKISHKSVTHMIHCNNSYTMSSVQSSSFSVLTDGTKGSNRVCAHLYNTRRCLS